MARMEMRRSDFLKAMILPVGYAGAKTAEAVMPDDPNAPVRLAGGKVVVQGENVTIAGCHFEGLETGIESRSGYAEITHNTLYNNHAGVFFKQT